MIRDGAVKHSRPGDRNIRGGKKEVKDRATIFGNTCGLINGMMQGVSRNKISKKLRIKTEL